MARGIQGRAGQGARAIILNGKMLQSFFLKSRMEWDPTNTTNSRQILKNSGV